MKNRRQRVWLTAIAVAGSVALYGCGGGSSPDTTPYGQADVDKAAQDAAAAAQAAEEARIAAVAAAEAAQAAAAQAVTDAKTAAGNAANAATTAANNAMAESFDVAAATAAAAAATAAAKDAETASTAAAAANARAAAVAHDDPAVLAAKAAAAAAAMEAEMAAGNAEASAAAAAASVTAAMQLQAQMMDDDDKAAMDAINADLAAEHATKAKGYADRAGEAATAARALADAVRGGGDPDPAAVMALEAAARQWEGEAKKAKELADGISAEGNEAVMKSQEAARTAALNAAASLNQAMGATIAVQGYADSEAIAADRDAVAAANVHVETLRSVVDWIVGADENDVSGAANNASSAADLAPRLADNALADGGHDSQVTMERMTEMSALVSDNAAIRNRVAEARTEANMDYDSAVPLFENNKMNKPGAEVMSADDLATGSIVRSGMNGDNTRAFMVNGFTVQSAATISKRNDLDYTGHNRAVTTADYVYDANDELIGFTTEVVEYDRWQSEYTFTSEIEGSPLVEPAVRRPFDYITFGIWAHNPDRTNPYARGATSAVQDSPATINDRPSAEFGTFVFADHNMLWQRAPGGGISAQYEGEHATVYEVVNHPSEIREIWAIYGPARVTVNFHTDTVGASFFWQQAIQGPDYTLNPFYEISGLTLNGDSTISMAENTSMTASEEFKGGAITSAAEVMMPIMATGGIFGSDAEEVALMIRSRGVSPESAATRATIVFDTVVGARHESHQTAQ